MKYQIHVKNGGKEIILNTATITNQTAFILGSPTSF